MMIVIDPYECLGIDKGCFDEQQIKEAFKKKSNILDPKNTNGVTRLEFINLNKSYLYIINQLRSESSGNGNGNGGNSGNGGRIPLPLPHQQARAQIPQQQQLPPRQLPRSVPPTQHLPPPQITKSGIGSTGSSSGIMSHLSIKEFNPVLAEHEISLQKTRSTNYQDLINENKNNHHFDNVLQLDNWNGLDNFNQTAPILHDGTQMFVQSDSLMDNSSYLPQEYQFSNSRSASGMVSSSDLQSFRSQYGTGNNGAGGGKLNNREFQNRMSQMENSFNSKLVLEQQEKKDLISRYLKK
jgi:hypothetical protein